MTMCFPVRRRTSRGEAGQSMVELALMMPLILLLILGTADIGMGFKTYIGLTNAAREGVRWISAHPQDVAGGLQRAADEAAKVGLSQGSGGTGGITITLSPAQSSYAAGNKVTMTLSGQYALLFGAVTHIPTLSLHASATMVVLYDE